MIIHSVYFWLDESLDADQKSAFEAGMKALFTIDVAPPPTRGDAR